jgi:ATP synthase protein I
MAEGRGGGNADEQRAREVRRVSLGITIPTTFAAAIVVGVAIGYGLDKWLGTGPWLTLIFLGLGIAAGIREILSVLNKMDH